MSAQAIQLPVLHQDSGLRLYMEQIKRFPILERDEEYTLAKRWREHEDAEAAHTLVTSHLRLVAKIAMGYRGYGLPVSDLISEGNVGMMQAVKKFDPERGFRLATYAMWWIRAAIQEYILHSWSLVKMGTTAAQKKLFFNLRQLKNRLQALDNTDLPQEQVQQIAQTLAVPEGEVVDMNRRLAAKDHSLNTPHAEGGGEWQDWVQDDGQSQEEALAESQELGLRRRLLHAALKRLNPREREIIQARRLDEPHETLEALSVRFKISRERVRQIEARAFQKIQAYIAQAAS